MSQYSLSNIPLDLNDPLGFLHFWRDEAVRFMGSLHFDATETLRQAKLATGATKTRLESIAKAQSENRSVLLNVLEPLLKHPAAASMVVASPVLARPNGNRLSENFSNLFRDWSWDEREVSEHFKILNQNLPEGPLGDICILGAGTGRLAHDLGSQRECRSITATEINPLLFLLGEKILSGQKVTLNEIAELPRAGELATAKRELQAKATTGVRLVLNDFLEDRLPAGHFDIVVTPWFVDVIPLSFEETAAKINRLLKKDGTWINFGPLMFQTNERAGLLPVDEVLERMRHAQFDVGTPAEQTLTQLKSPLSATYRTDTVFSFKAVKTGDWTYKVPATSSVEPEYLSDFRKPVKLNLDLEEMAQSHLLVADVLQRCAEGKSIQLIADELAPEFGLPVQAVVPLIARVVSDTYKNQKFNPSLVLRG